MKKIWLLIAAIAVISCKEEAPVDYAVVSGTITNPAVKKITINAADRSVKATLDVAEDGSFADTLKIEEGTYTILNGRTGAQIYVEHGANINVSFDAKDFENTLTFTGSDISSYLYEKGKLSTEVLGQGYGIFELDEADFKAKFAEFKTKASEKLNAFAGISEDFKEKELRAINYSYLSTLSIYPMYHAHFAKKPDFKASEGFSAELDDIEYNNEEDFKFSPDYQRLVTNHYRKKAGDLIEKDGISQDIAYLNTLATIPSATIKNKLAYDDALNGITYTEDLQGYYDAFIALSTDEANKEEITKLYNDLLKVAKGQPSPKFVDYENYKGGTTSLDDLKGKFVYVDVWATWCGPCKAEIPHLQKVEEKYHGKNIEFVSISVDKKKDYEAWRTMIEEKQMGGIQLFADKDWASDFVTGYLIKGIPRFILIDTEGNIINANAPRPSDPKLITLFDEYKI